MEGHVQAVGLTALRPAAWNPRTISDARFQNLCRSIEADPEFLWRRPVLSQADGTIYAGNMRFRAAQHLGMETIPAIVEDVPDQLARERALRDNQQWGEWVKDDLAAVLAALEAEGRDIASLGFDREEVTSLLARARAAERVGTEDDLPCPAEIAPRCRRGELWVLGDHRLVCGDSTNAADVARLLDGAMPFLCVTDPPYGVNYEPAWRNEAAAKGLLAYSPSRIGEVTNDDRADWRAAWALFPGDVLYSGHPPGAPSLVHAAAIQGSGFEIRMQIIWAKSHFPIGRGDYHVRHEPCWYAVRKGKGAGRTDDRTQTTLWEITLDKNVEGGHSTQKPVECMARPIRNHHCEAVYDPFVGSGTTLIACEMLGRRCYAMEIEPQYADVVLARWEKYTGQTAAKG